MDVLWRKFTAPFTQRSSQLFQCGIKPFRINGPDMHRRAKSPKPPPTPRTPPSRPSSEFRAARDQIRRLQDDLALQNQTDTVPRSEYESLYARLRTEQEDHFQVLHAFRDLQTRYDGIVRENANFQWTISILKEQAKSSNVVDHRHSKIEDLQFSLNQAESLHLADRQAILDSISKRKQSSDNARCYEAHIAAVNRSLAELISRNREFSQTIESLESQNRKFAQTIKSLESENCRLTAEVRRQPTISKNTQTPPMNVGFAEAALISANQTIAELRARVSALETIGAKLQTALDQRNRAIRRMQNEIDDLSGELLPLRQLREEFQRASDDWKADIESARAREAELIEGMQMFTEFHKEQIEKESKRSEAFQNELTKGQSELKQFKEETEEYLAQTYGLPEAVNEMRQLRIMVSVRDTQIADMVVELGWYQKVIGAIEAVLPASFDFEEFYGKLEREQNRREMETARNRALDLVQRTLAVRKDDGFGKIEIVIGTPRGEKQVYVASQNDQGELEILSDGQGRESDAESSSESVDRSEFGRSDSAAQTTVFLTEVSIQELKKVKAEIAELQSQIERGKHRNPLKISARTLAVQTIGTPRPKLASTSHNPLEIHSQEQNQSEVELRTEFEKLQKVVAELEIEIHALNQFIEQKDRKVADLQRMVAGLEKRLAEQTAEFIEKVQQLNAWSDELCEAQSKGHHHLDAVTANLSQTFGGQLEQEVQNQNQQPRDQVMMIERIPTEKSNGMELLQVNTKLQRRVSELEHEKAAVDRLLKEIQSNSEVLLQKQSEPMRVVDGDMRLVRVKYEKLSIQNDELQLRLVNANATIERLNELVQRKETELASVQAQITQFKQRSAPSSPRIVRGSFQ
jgi:chromosome segregation ATPase